MRKESFKKIKHMMTTFQFPKENLGKENTHELYMQAFVYHTSDFDVDNAEGFIAFVSAYWCASDGEILRCIEKVEKAYDKKDKFKMLNKYANYLERSLNLSSQK